MTLVGANVMSYDIVMTSFWRCADAFFHRLRDYKPISSEPPLTGSTWCHYDVIWHDLWHWYMSYDIVHDIVMTSCWHRMTLASAPPKSSYEVNQSHMTWLMTLVSASNVIHDVMLMWWRCHMTWHWLSLVWYMMSYDANMTSCCTDRWHWESPKSHHMKWNKVIWDDSWHYLLVPTWRN